MGYTNNIVIKNFKFHSTRVFISKEKHAQNFANDKIFDFLKFFLAILQKKIYSIRKSIKCGIKCKKFQKEILIC